jgi:hypothetical protein
MPLLHMEGKIHNNIFNLVKIKMEFPKVLLALQVANV